MTGTPMQLCVVWAMENTATLAAPTYGLFHGFHSVFGRLLVMGTHAAKPTETIRAQVETTGHHSYHVRMFGSHLLMGKGKSGNY